MNLHWYLLLEIINVSLTRCYTVFCFWGGHFNPDLYVVRFLTVYV